MDQWERDSWNQARGARFPLIRLRRIYQMFDLFLGSALLLIPAALFWKSLLRTPRLKVLWWCLATGALVAATGIQYYQHYAAPILPVILVFTVEGFRHLRVWETSGKPIGRFLCRAMPGAMLLIAGSQIGGQIYRPRTIEESYPPNGRRVRLEDALVDQTGGHVIFVRYTNYRMPQEEWIYNHADIDNSLVIWAQDMGPQENRRLMDYFKGRSFWLLKPDENPNQAERYDPTALLPK
jgi:hypothetical protein